MLHVAVTATCAFIELTKQAGAWKIGNVMYTVDDPKKRAVGFKLSVGMDVPAELAKRFKFATMKSKLAGPIRGTFFVIKGEHTVPVPAKKK